MKSASYKAFSLFEKVCQKLFLLMYHRVFAPVLPTVHQRLGLVSEWTTVWSGK